MSKVIPFHPPSDCNCIASMKKCFRSIFYPSEKNDNDDDENDGNSVEDAERSLSRLERLSNWIYRNEYYVWMYSFCICAAIIWLILLFSDSPAFDDYYQSDSKLSPLQTLRSVALAPFGAWLRWGLTRVPEIKKSFPDVNPQTVAANLIAVCLGCCLSAFQPTWVWSYPISSGE